MKDYKLSKKAKIAISLSITAIHLLTLYIFNYPNLLSSSIFWGIYHIVQLWFLYKVCK